MSALPPRSMVAGRGRLTDVERRERAMKEIDLQRLLVGKDGLAPLLGWEHAHFRKGRTKDGWTTSTSGSLGKGWPDLVLVRQRDSRLIFVELKRQLEHPSPDQVRVLGALRAIVGETNGRPYPNGGYAGPPRAEVHVWRPSDLRDPIESSRIYEVLR